MNDNGEDILSDKIVMYFGYFKEYSLKSIATTCVKLIISDQFKYLCMDTFIFPTPEEVKALVLEELKRDFDEKVIPIIEKTYPHLSDDEIEAKIADLERMYEKEHEEQLISTTNAALNELRIAVKSLQKELKALKRKYTI